MSTRDPARARALALLGLVLANVIGGASYPAQKLALQGLPPATVTCLRNATAFVLLLGVARQRRTSFAGWNRADLARAGLIGSVAFALPMWLGIVGVERSSASNASLLILLEPVMIVALAWFFLGERIGGAKIASLVLGLAGALAIVLEGARLGGLFAGEHLAGNAILALHGILWGCYTPLARPLSARHDPIALTAITTAASLPLLACGAWFEAPRWNAGPELWNALGWTLALGVLVSFFSVLLWLAALRHVPASSVAGFVFLQPLTGVLVGLAFLGESLSSGASVGGALILCGVLLDAFVTARGGSTRAEAG